MRLSDMGIKALKAPTSGAIIYPDDLLTGFGVRVSTGGTKSYVITHGVRRQRETIGRVGVLSLQDARHEAKRRLAEYTLGKTKIASPSWTVAVEEFLAEIKNVRKERTYRGHCRLLRKHFKFGETKLCDITTLEFAKKLDKLVHAPSERHHAFMVLHTFLRWAHGRYYLDVDPLSRMKSAYRYRPRTRVLSDVELAAVWHAADAIGSFGAIVQLLILTGQRLGEISGLTRSMVGDGTVVLPSSLTKNRREHVFPVGARARALLDDRLAAISDDPDAFLFVARGSQDRSFSGFSKSKAALDRLSGVSNWVLHDLRRTFASGLASLGVAIPVTEKLLNHVSGSLGGIVAVYQRYDFMHEMREAVAKWDRHIVEITGEKSPAPRAVSGIAPASHVPKLSSEIACGFGIPDM